MRHRITIATVCLVLGTLALSGGAFAHGTSKTGRMIPTDAQMKKLHAMMPMFSIATAKLEIALEKVEVSAVEIEADKIKTAIPELKKSRPHKNVKQRKLFVEYASALGDTVSATVDLAKKGDLEGAKRSFEKVEDICAACHAKFRD